MNPFKVLSIQEKLNEIVSNLEKPRVEDKKYNFPEDEAGRDTLSSLLTTLEIPHKKEYDYHRQNRQGYYQVVLLKTHDLVPVKK